MAADKKSSSEDANVSETDLDLEAVDDDAPSSDVDDEKGVAGSTVQVVRRFFAGYRRLTLSLVVLLTISIVANGVLAWRLHASGKSAMGASASLSAAQEQATSRQRAEQIALGYAKGAAEMDYKDLQAWNRRLTSNTSPELTKKLKDAASSMEQIVIPLQWVSTPTPIAATMRSEHDGVFVVNSFISVITKTVQAPSGVQSTATYTVTVNKNDNWVITDVGGVDSAVNAGK